MDHLDLKNTPDKESIKQDSLGKFTSLKLKVLIMTIFFTVKKCFCFPTKIFFFSELYDEALKFKEALKTETDSKKIEDYWSKTYLLRRKDAINGEYEDLEIIFEFWPVLKYHVIGPSLVSSL